MTKLLHDQIFIFIHEVALFTQQRVAYTIWCSLSVQNNTQKEALKMVQLPIKFRNKNEIIQSCIITIKTPVTDLVGLNNVR